MKTINVNSAFTLNLGNGEKRHFASGSQRVEDEIADHWYVQAHSVAAQVVENNEAQAETARLAAEKATQEKAAAEKAAAEKAAAEKAAQEKAAAEAASAPSAQVLATEEGKKGKGGK